MNKVYLLNLSGGGDTEIKLVNKFVWKWIFSSYDTSKLSYDEIVPEKVISEMKKYKTFNKDSGKIMVTRGSYENDRALYAPGELFHSTKKMIKYLKENNLEISQEYDGCIY